MLCAIALQITIARHTPTRGPPGWAIWAGAAAFVGYGFYGLINGNKRRNAMAREKREARMNIQAFLQADADAQHIRVQRRFMRGVYVHGVHVLVPRPAAPVLRRRCPVHVPYFAKYVCVHVLMYVSHGILHKVTCNVHTP
eukprot:TRINITY_DN2478_c0_g3_i2.p2 TRINITY_DN2478_c0_g3~~TRINITY_DN2478_c0_g3_i2.p2  ORF type:complete len:140 (-),score=21.89 TRINITY_DN2478_c0_g3_i2:578-997(-)